MDHNSLYLAIGFVFQSPFQLADAYKLSHWKQYPKGTVRVYDNFTPRKYRGGEGFFVWFGLQPFLQIMSAVFNDFFRQNEENAVQEFSIFYKSFFGTDDQDAYDKVRALHRLQYLPLHIKALPEGSVVPHGTPCATIVNTHDDFFWLTGFIETWMSAEVWGMCTSATTATMFRSLSTYYNNLTSDNAWFVDFQNHDFSPRGMFGIAAAAKSGAGHLASGSKGTDALMAIPYVQHHYGRSKDLLGTSVPATEHSVQEAFLGEDENTEVSDEAYLLNTLETYPKGIVSMVSDGYDFWRMIVTILPKCKEQIMARDGKLVIRPDSSPKTPFEIICGDKEAPEGTPEHLGLIQCLWNIFGGEINSKGYKVLDSHIGAIYGEAITFPMAQKIYATLTAMGFCTDNIVFGIGSYTYQCVTRDTHSIAIKCTAVATRNGGDIVWKSVFKDPKTDRSSKKSSKGLLAVVKENGKYILLQDVTPEVENTGLLTTRFKDGRLEGYTTFDQVRERVAQEMPVWVP